MAQLNPALSLVGIAKQTAKGAAAAAPVFGHGVYDGTLANPERSVVVDPVTSAYAAATSAYLDSILGAASYSNPAYFGVIGMYLLAALGADAVVGSGTFTHTLTLGRPLPYFTLWNSFSGVVQSVQDCKLDQMEISWKNNDPLKFAPQWKGGAPLLTGAFSPTTSESGDNRFTPVGGTFQLDVVGSTLAAVPMTAGSIKINNNVDQIVASGALTPNDVCEDLHELDISIDCLVSDLGMWKEALTGTPSGTTPATVLAYGGFSVQFVSGTNSLTLACTNCPFVVAFPAVDAKNASRMVTLTATPTIASGGSTVMTATLVNSVASY